MRLGACSQVLARTNSIKLSFSAGILRGLGSSWGHDLELTEAVLEFGHVLGSKGRLDGVVCAENLHFSVSG